jgi:hypothetical protein
MDLGIKTITIFKKTLSGYYLTLANFAALRDIISLSKAQRTLHLGSRKGAKDAKRVSPNILTFQETFFDPKNKTPPLPQKWGL